MRTGDTFPIARDSRGAAYARRPAGSDGTNLAAQFTGEVRQAKAGEWYISGAIPEAYLVHNDTMNRHHIARLVVVTPGPAVVRPV